MGRPAWAAAAVAALVFLSSAAAAAGSEQPPGDLLPLPRTVPFDTAFPLGSDDLPMDKPPLARPPGARPGDPHQVHLTLASGGGVWVSWATGDGHVGGGGDKAAAGPRLASVVQYGPAADALEYTARGPAAETYTQAYPGGGSYTSPRLHHVHLSAADLGKAGGGGGGGTGGGGGGPVFYRVGDPGPGGAWSAVKSFTPPPPAGVGAYPLRLAVLGDLGQTHNSSTTLDHLAAAARGGDGAAAAPVGGGVKAASTPPSTTTTPPASALLYLGDMSYADDWNPNGTLRTWPAPPLPYTPSYGPKWDAWGRFTEGLLSTLPAVTTAGNHEVETDARGRSFQAWRARYKSGDGGKGGRRPPSDWDASAPLYSSVDVGPAHVISLNTYAPWEAGSAQRAWLERDLKAVNRSLTPWVFVLAHAPWYSTYASHYREVECMRLAVEGILVGAGVDAFFSGHVHAYERTSRVMDRVPQPDAGGCAPRYVVAGDGGNLERLYTVFTSGPGPALCPPPETADECGRDEAAAAAANPATSQPFCDPAQPRWSLYRQPAYGFGMLEVLSPTAARWAWYSNTDGVVALADEVVWSRDDACLTEGGRAAAAAAARAAFGGGFSPDAAERAAAAKAAPPPAAGYAPPPPAELPSQLAAAAAAGVGG